MIAIAHAYADANDETEITVSPGDFGDCGSVHEVYIQSAPAPPLRIMAEGRRESILGWDPREPATKLRQTAPEDRLSRRMVGKVAKATSSVRAIAGKVRRHRWHLQLTLSPRF